MLPLSIAARHGGRITEHSIRVHADSRFPLLAALGHESSEIVSGMICCCMAEGEYCSQVQGIPKGLIWSAISIISFAG